MELLAISPPFLLVFEKKYFTVEFSEYFYVGGSDTIDEMDFRTRFFRVLGSPVWS